MKKILMFCFFVGFTASSIIAQDFRIADLKIQGNKKTKTGFIKKVSSIKSGDKLDSLSCILPSISSE